MTYEVLRDRLLEITMEILSNSNNQPRTTLLHFPTQWIHNNFHHRMAYKLQSQMCPSLDYKFPLGTEKG
jgi:hypothetical protein